MRYLGNKESILTEISNLLSNKGLLQKGYTFFDAFCGSGSVAEYFKSYYDIIINDNLTWSVMYTKRRLCAPMCTFEKLGFDPFEFLNTTNSIHHGFIYKNYAPTETQRMYFTPENAERIDYFRMQIHIYNCFTIMASSSYVPSLCFIAFGLMPHFTNPFFSYR